MRLQHRRLSSSPQLRPSATPRLWPETRSRIKVMRSRWPKASFLTPKQTTKDSALRESYLIYSKLSADAAHPTVLGLKRHLAQFEENGEQVVGLDVDPPEKGNELAETIDLACNAMISACVAVHQILDGLSINDEIRKMFIEYGELSGALRRTA
jgi:hypothetical protein